MSNNRFFWNGQPVTGPVYPQMGDIQQVNPSLSACGSGIWPGAASTFSAAMHHRRHLQQVPNFSGGAAAAAAGTGAMPLQMEAMGDFGHINRPSMPASLFAPQPQGQFESCIENGEAFCAYNNINTSLQGGGGGTMEGRSGAQGDFW